MATSKKSKAAAETVNEAPVAQPEANVSVYTVDELAENHKLFKTSYEIVVVALRKAGKETASFAEAQKIIESFKKREVK
jgi:hypothetical protein